MFSLKHQSTQREDTARWRVVWGFRTWPLCRLIWVGQKEPTIRQEVAVFTIVFSCNPTMNLRSPPHFTHMKERGWVTCLMSHGDSLLSDTKVLAHLVSQLTTWLLCLFSLACFITTNLQIKKNEKPKSEAWRA